MKHVISLYCGAGGIDEGATQAGLSTTIAIDTDKDACLTLKANHPETEVINGKVSDYISSLPTEDVLAVFGGPPCPDFSRANTGRTFDMCEVNNFWAVVERCKPRYFLMENVPDVKRNLYKTSYLVDAADYGVPQNRLRRFFTNLPSPPPTHSEKPKSNFYGDILKPWVSIGEALHLDGLVDHKTIPNWKKKNHTRTTDQPSRTILTDASGNGIWIEDRKINYEKEHRQYGIDRPSITVHTDSRLFVHVPGFNGQNRKEITKPITEPALSVLASRDIIIGNTRIFSNKYIRDKNPIMFDKHPPHYLDKPGHTVAAKDYGFAKGESVSDGSYMRKITNPELAILQGFPMSYKFIGNKGSVRKQIGNAVPPPVAKAFFSQINRHT